MANATNKSQAQRGPAFHVALGDVSVSVFSEHCTSEDGKRDWKSYSISLQRSYFDPTKQQRVYVSTLFDRDLLDASQALVQAYHWIETSRREVTKAIAQEEQATNRES